MSLSPYTTSATSLYQGSPAGQSPHGMQVFPQPLQVQTPWSYSEYSGISPHGHLQGQSVNEYASMHGMAGTMTFGRHPRGYDASSFTGMNVATPTTYPPPHHALNRSPLQAQSTVPRAAGMQPDPNTIHAHSLPGSIYHQQAGQAVYPQTLDEHQYMAQYGASIAGNDGMSPSRMGMRFAPTTLMPLATGQMYEAQPMPGYHVPDPAPAGQGYQY